MAPPLQYVEPPDCPEGMTLAAWRAERAERHVRRGLRSRLRDRRRRRAEATAAQAAGPRRLAA